MLRSTLHHSDKIDVEDRLRHRKLRPCSNFAFKPLYLRYGLRVHPMTDWSSLSTTLPALLNPAFSV